MKKICFLLGLFILLVSAHNLLAWQTPTITDIRVANHEDYSRVVFDLKTKLPYRVNRDSGSIVIDFPSGRLEPQNTSLKVKDGRIEEIRADQVGRGTRVTIRLGQRAGSFNSLLLENPYRLVIDVRKADIKKNNLDVIIIDAGHGGKDPGAIGRRGLKEKVVTLDIARRLEKKLKREDKLKIILTRDRDEFISLDNRVKIANQNAGALFISIHTNSVLRKDIGGFETFYLAESKTAEARAVVTLENSVLELEERPFWSDLGKELEKILWDLRYAEFKVESRELASTVQANLDKRLTLANRGTKGALLYVLRGAAMPAVLAETAFISNPREEVFLSRASFRETVAQALADSILQYRDKFEKSRGFTE